MSVQSWARNKDRFSVSDIIRKIKGQAYLSKFYFEIEPGRRATDFLTAILNNTVGNTSSDGDILDVTVIGSEIELRDLFFYSQGITIPSRGLNTESYVYSNGFRIEIPTSTNFGDGNINIPIISDNKYILYDFFIKWMNKIHSKETGYFTFHDDYTTNLFIKQLDYTAADDITNNINSFHGGMTKDKTFVYGVELINCFPKAVSAIEFRHDSKERVEFNVNMSYEGINYN